MSVLVSALVSVSVGVDVSVGFDVRVDDRVVVSGGVRVDTLNLDVHTLSPFTRTYTHTPSINNTRTSTYKTSPVV